MTISEVRKKKRDLEEFICNELRQFCIETGAVVSYVNIMHSTVFGREPSLIDSVDIEARI